MIELGVRLDLFLEARARTEESSPILILFIEVWQEVAVLHRPSDVLFLKSVYEIVRSGINESHVALVVDVTKIH